MAYQNDKQKNKNLNSDFEKEHNLDNLTEQEKKRMHAAYSEMGKKGGQARAKQLGHDGYVKMGHKGGVIRAERMAKGLGKSSK